MKHKAKLDMRAVAEWRYDYIDYTVLENKLQKAAKAVRLRIIN